MEKKFIRVDEVAKVTKPAAAAAKGISIKQPHFRR